VADLLRPGAPAAATARVLPPAALPLAPLKLIDATLAWKIDSLQAPRMPALTGLQLRATLDQGQLQVALQDTQLAGGRLSGQFVLDSQAASPKARIELQAKNLRLEKMLPAPVRIEGPVSGQLKLSGHGPSVAAWLGSASGRLGLALPSGSLSPGLDAKLALNVGKLVRSYFSSDKAVPIRCGALKVDFADGSGRVRQLVLDTERTRVDGLGQVQLREESWSLLLTPQAHQRALLALNSSLRVQGSFRDAGITLVDRQPIDPGAASGCD
ncbi:MAG: AsmA family protein, partial [Rhizobacter sp.]|nr:AsmA family protein [Rhizobacter sp.]